MDHPVKIFTGIRVSIRYFAAERLAHPSKRTRDNFCRNNGFIKTLPMEDQLALPLVVLFLLPLTKRLLTAFISSDWRALKETIEQIKISIFEH
jgi:hypothetical protein